MKECINLKALAQMILDQRSDIEQFFLEAMEQVKEEKRRKLEQEKSNENPPQKQYQDGLMSYDNQSQQQQKITVELSDLDWEDRERILRLLFSKMNTGQSASDWRETDDQSQERASSSHLATAQMNQSFREQEEEEDYGDEQDATVFAQTTVPEND